MLCLLTSTRVQAFSASAFAINLDINDYVMQVYLEGQETIDWLDRPQTQLVKPSIDTGGVLFNPSGKWLYNKRLAGPATDFPLLLTFGVIFIGRRSLLEQ